MAVLYKVHPNLETCFGWVINKIGGILSIMHMQYIVETIM